MSNPNSNFIDVLKPSLDLYKSVIDDIKVNQKVFQILYNSADNRIIYDYISSLDLSDFVKILIDLQHNCYDLFKICAPLELSLNTDSSESESHTASEYCYDHNTPKF